MATVFVRPHHQPVQYLSVSEWAEHNRNKRLLQTCYKMKKKQNKQKTPNNVKIRLRWVPTLQDNLTVTILPYTAQT